MSKKPAADSKKKTMNEVNRNSVHHETCKKETKFLDKNRTEHF